MAERRPLVHIAGLVRELPQVDTLPIPFQQFAASADLAANPAAAITFTGCAAFTDIAFVWQSVSHDNTGANQTFSMQVSVDGSVFGGASVISPSISAAGIVNGRVDLFGNALTRVRAIGALQTGNIADLQISAPVSTDRIITVSGRIAAVRFTPTTSGNFDAGTILAFGR